MKDWENLTKTRHISILDIVYNRNNPYYLEQHLSKKILVSKNNPYKELIDWNSFSKNATPGRSVFRYQTSRLAAFRFFSPKRQSRDHTPWIDAFLVNWVHKKNGKPDCGSHKGFLSNFCSLSPGGKIDVFQYLENSDAWIPQHPVQSLYIAPLEMLEQNLVNRRRW